MDELLSSLVTWSDGKLVPLSSLPSIVEATASQQEQANLSSQEHDLQADLSGSCGARNRPSSSSTGGGLPKIITPGPQSGGPVHVHTQSIPTMAYDRTEVEEKKLARAKVERNIRQDVTQFPRDMARASQNNSAFGELSSLIYTEQTLRSQRSIARSYSRRLQTSHSTPPLSARGTAVQALPYSLAQMDALPPPHVDGLDMMSMDDFEKAHPYVPPPAKMTNLTSVPSDGLYTDTFNMTCQMKGLTQYFTYVEPSQGCFLATAHINNERLEQVGPYASKKAAKEAAYKAALPKLQSFPDKAEVKRAEIQSAAPVLRYIKNNTGENVSKMNMICQQKSLVSNITFAEPKKGCFTAAMTIDGQLIDEVGFFANKKDAKEELCRVTYPKLLEMESRKKRKSMDVHDELPDAPEILVEENWVGTLVKHCQHSKIPNPVYNETDSHPSHGPFSCAVHFAGSPPSGFGATAGPFKKKADAKKNAAMESVLWLRHQGQLAGIGSIKRRKSAASAGVQTVPSAHSTGLSQTLNDAMDISDDGPAQSGSIGKQTQDLCLRLGFTQPTFELIPLSDSFYNVHAVFAPQDVRYEPRLEGAVAPIYNVHGKKTAKNECWAELWKVLEEIRLSRMG